MTATQAALSQATDAPPPMQPDPEIMSNLEGDWKALKRVQDAARRELAAAGVIKGNEPAPGHGTRDSG